MLKKRQAKKGSCVGGLRLFIVSLDYKIPDTHWNFCVGNMGEVHEDKIGTYAQKV